MYVTQLTTGVHYRGRVYKLNVATTEEGPEILVIDSENSTVVDLNFEQLLHYGIKKENEKTHSRI